VYRTIFGNLLNGVNVIKFRCTLNFLLLATLAVMDTFLDGYKRKEIMKVVLVKTMRLAQVQKWYVKGLNANEYDTECLLFGYTNNDVEGEEKS
jgi:hypothetical protein